MAVWGEILEEFGDPVFGFPAGDEGGFLDVEGEGEEWLVAFG